MLKKIGMNLKGIQTTFLMLLWLKEKAQGKRNGLSKDHLRWLILQSNPNLQQFLSQVMKAHSHILFVLDVDSINPPGYLVSALEQYLLDKINLFKDVRNLHPYWHLSNHPLWLAAHKQLCLEVPTVRKVHDFIETNHTNQVRLQVDKSSLAKIEYSHKEHIRIARLREKFDEVANIAKSSKPQY